MLRSSGSSIRMVSIRVHTPLRPPPAVQGLPDERVPARVLREREEGEKIFEGIISVADL